MTRTILSLSLILCLASCDRPDSPSVDTPSTAAAPPSEPESQGGHEHRHHAHHEVLPAGEIVPGASLYQLEVELVSQDGKPRTWQDFRGGPVVVSMVYSTCTTACPMIVTEIKQILAAAGAPDHRVLLVSMDPDRDDPAALTEMAKRHQLADNWTLVRPSPESLPEIAAALGVRYRRLPSGDFNHSQVIALLDPAGVIAARSEGLGPQRDAVISAVKGAAH